MAGEPSNALRALVTRRSIPALQLREPGPSPDQISIAIDAALRAPDHGNLKPWRCVLVRGAARAQLSKLLVRRTQEREPATPPPKLEKLRTMPLIAPLVVVVAARVRPDHKVPEIEQLLSCGAATMNMMTAFHAQGYASIWLTGGNAYDPQVAGSLGLQPDERCLGFLYVGSTESANASAPPHLEHAAFVRDWSG